MGMGLNVTAHVLENGHQGGGAAGGEEVAPEALADARVDQMLRDLITIIMIIIIILLIIIMCCKKNINK